MGNSSSKKIDTTMFRAYDIRGVYPKSLNKEVAFRTAKAYAKIFPYAKKVVVARDTRLSSPFLLDSVVKGLNEKKVEVTDIGIAPDALLYFSIFNYGYDGGIMVSGSHNPKDYNGLMLNVRDPETKKPKDVSGNDLERIKNEVLQDLEPYDTTERMYDLRSKRFDPSESYINYVTQRVKLKRPLKIIIDSGNGSCGLLPARIFKKLGCEVNTLFWEFDGTFPNHLPDPYDEENLVQIKKEVWDTRADLGFSYDADGDRVAPIDNMGNVISGDFCLLILAKETLLKRKGPVVHCMRASKAFLDEMKKEGAETFFSISHHIAVMENIVKHNAVFGGEITYHFFFPDDYYLVDDALFASLKLAEALSKHSDISGFIDTLPHYFASEEVFIDSKDEEKFEIIGRLKRYLRENNYDFVDIDGARINFPRGWALARASNTSPIIKCRFEGETRTDLVEIEKKALEIFEKVGIPLTEKNYIALGL